jgi:hypothetical protein
MGGAARNPPRDRHELHRLHSKRVVDVRTDPAVGRPSLDVSQGARAPAIATPSAIEDHLDVVLSGEPRPNIFVEARMITGNDQEVPDRSPNG